MQWNCMKENCYSPSKVIYSSGVCTPFLITVANQTCIRRSFAHSVLADATVAGVELLRNATCSKLASLFCLSVAFYSSSILFLFTM